MGVLLCYAFLARNARRADPPLAAPARRVERVPGAIHPRHAPVDQGLGHLFKPPVEALPVDHERSDERVQVVQVFTRLVILLTHVLAIPLVLAMR